MSPGILSALSSQVGGSIPRGNDGSPGAGPKTRSGGCRHLRRVAGKKAGGNLRDRGTSLGGRTHECCCEAAIVTNFEGPGPIACQHKLPEHTVTSESMGHVAPKLWCDLGQKQ